jgi:SAM-dependent methyltransferase
MGCDGAWRRDPGVQATGLLAGLASVYAQSRDWFENDDFWRDLYPYMFPAERFAASREQVEMLLKLTGFTGRAVLDLCCGPGRHGVAFAQHGFEVTGVDRSQFLLDRARERATEAAVSVEWVREDMRRFIRPATFDLACNMFASFGYFENEEDNLRVLRNVHESLRDGGAFVMEMLCGAAKDCLPHYSGDPTVAAAASSLVSVFVGVNSFSLRSASIRFTSGSAALRVASNRALCASNSFDSSPNTLYAPSVGRPSPV